MVGQAQRWIVALTGDASTPMTWQVFSDIKPAPDDLRPWHRRATVDDAYDDLERANGNGCGIFATVNECRGGRRADHVVRVRAVFADIDDEGERQWHVRPSMIVRSARGLHPYWIMADGESPTPVEFTDAQKRIAAHYRSDPAVHDPSRVMRVPGFMHRKGEPIPVEIVYDDGPRWTLADVVAALPQAQPKASEDGPRADLPQGDAVVAPKYVRAALEDEASMVAGAESGRRAAAFARAAKIGRYVSRGLLDHGAAVARFLQACEVNGSLADHGEEEMRRHIVNGLAKGADNEIPDGAQQEDDDLDEWVPDIDEERGDGPPIGRVPAQTWARGDDVELGADLVRRLGGRRRAVYTEDAFWQCDGSSWWKREAPAVRVAAQAYAGTYVRRGKDKDGEPKVAPLAMSQSRVYGVAGAAADRVSQEDFFTVAPIGAAFGSRFVKAAGGRVQIEELSAEHRVRSTHVSSWELDEATAKPPFADRILDETWSGCDDLEDRKLFLWRWLGLALLGLAPSRKTHLLLVGEKDTGKSAILHMILSVFPADSVRAVAIQDMAHEYHRAALAGAKINAVNELPARDIMVSEAAKAILSGDSVGCRQPAGRVFFLRSRCAHVLAANALPAVLDPALSGRFVVLDTPNVVPPEKQDARMEEKMREEAPSIAWHAINAAAALIESRAALARPPSSRALAQQWAIDSDSVKAWASEAIVPSGGGTGVASSVLYDRYRSWCEDHGHKPVSSTKMARRLKAAGFRSRRSNGTKWAISFAVGSESGSADEWAYH